MAVSAVGVLGKAELHSAERRVGPRLPTADVNNEICG